MDAFLSAVIAALAAAGLILQSRLRSGAPLRVFFAYYTNLSNLATLIYRVLYLIPGTPLRSAAVETVMTLGIFLTNVIYAFVLGPGLVRWLAREENRRPRLYEYLVVPMLGADKKPRRRFFGNLCVHYLVPLLSVAKWLLFPPGAIPFSVTYGWLVLPLCYLVFVLIRARTKTPVRSDGGLYPYRFMDLDELGIRRFAASMLLTALGCFLLGLLFYLISLLR